MYHPHCVNTICNNKTNHPYTTLYDSNPQSYMVGWTRQPLSNLQLLMAIMTEVWWVYILNTRHVFIIQWVEYAVVHSEVLLLIYVWPKMIQSVYCEFHIILFISSYIGCQISVSLTLLNIWQTGYTVAFFNHPHLAYQSPVWNFYCALFTVLRFLNFS